MITYKVAIIGGGISGLHTAYKLAQAGIDFILFEAKPEVGGRIFRNQVDDTFFDLGPSWFWPGQENIAALIRELDLDAAVFQQYSKGDAIYQSADNAVKKGVSDISMTGSYRLDGGLARITNTLLKSIRALAGFESVQTSTVIDYVSASDSVVHVVTDAGETYVAEKLVLAIPARIAVSRIKFAPQFSNEKLRSLNSVATWMASHAKAVLVYERSFWRESGLSGDVISHYGPLSEIHDASPRDASLFALFGFLAVPPQHRIESSLVLKQKIVSQLVGLFGDAAANYKTFLYKDWARDELVATKRDQTLPNHHASNHWHARVDWQNRLIWSGSEAAEGHYNGYIEGALVASKQALSAVLNKD